MKQHNKKREPDVNIWLFDLQIMNLIQLIRIVINTQ